MKTIILFSAIFYWIGVKVGNTLDSFKSTLVPSKSVFSIPFNKAGNSDKQLNTYQFRSGDEETGAAKEEVSTIATQEGKPMEVAEGKTD